MSFLADADNLSAGVISMNGGGFVISNEAELTVNPLPVAPYIIIQPTSQTVTAGQAVLFTVEAGGDTPISYQWKKDGYNLYNDLYISGVTSSTLTITNAYTYDAGSYTVVVTNAAGSVTSNTVTLTVTPPVSVAPTITTAALPNGTAGTAYSQALAASGDTPIIWSLESGSLPTGLTLSSAGIISGTPTESGTFNFIVKAVNNTGSNTKALSIVINPDAPVTYTITASAASGGMITPSGTISVQAGASQTFTFTPNSNYAIAFITVDGINLGAISSYTFDTVSADHTIIAAFTYVGSPSFIPGNDGVQDDVKEDSKDDTNDNEQDYTQDTELPVIVDIDVPVKVNKNSHAVVSVKYRSVSDAITKALNKAREHGDDDSDITIALNVNLPETAKSLELNIYTVDSCIRCLYVGDGQCGGIYSAYSIIVTNIGSFLFPPIAYRCISTGCYRK